jgi:hypothetical protein
MLINAIVKKFIKFLATGQILPSSLYLQSNSYGRNQTILISDNSTETLLDLSQNVNQYSTLLSNFNHTPIVLWHGMGDTCCSPKSMGSITTFLKDRLPGVFVHSIQLGDTFDEDRNAGFFGKIIEFRSGRHLCIQTGAGQQKKK